MTLPKGYKPPASVGISTGPIGTPPLTGTGRLPAGVPYFRVIDTRMFKRNFLYYLFFLQDRMAFVMVGKSSFVVDNLQHIVRAVGIVAGSILILVIIISGSIIYYEFILGIQPNREEGDIVFTDWLLVAIPVITVCLVSLIYLPRYSASKLSVEKEKHEKVLNLLSKKDFDDAELRLSDASREIYYSEVNSFYIGESDLYNEMVGEKNNGLLTFELRENIRNQGYSTGINSSNKYLSYNIPLDEDFTRCNDILNYFLLAKKTNKIYHLKK
jgi:hypothetical protein